MKLRRYVAGVSLMEAIIALGVITAATAIAISLSRVAEDKGKVVAKADFVRQLVRGVTQTYGVSGPYPAGTTMPAYLATLPSISNTPYDATTGCFALDGVTDLCIRVPDDGAALGTSTGFGSFWDVTLITRAGGSSTASCVEIASAARTYMISAGVGADEPRDGAGQWLQGRPWDDWWRARCDEPLTANFRMR